jgi:glycosyltransferase involved in cell wall biosynthesis
MSNGLACIVNNYGVPFSDKEVFTMHNNKPETIADVLTKFVSNPELIKFYSDNAVKTIKSEFSVGAFSNKYFKVYKELM